MKRLLMTIIVFILLVPVFVYAEECNSNSIKIESINLKNKSDYTEEVSPVSIKDNKINVDLKMYSIDDFIEYNLSIKNTSDDTYYIDKNSLSIKSDYFDYSISFKDNSNKVDPKSEKELNLRIQYNKPIDKDKYDGGKYISNRDIPFVLSTSKYGIDNPLTGNGTSVAILIILLIFTLYFVFLKKNKNVVYLFIIGLIVIPISVYAVCVYKVDIKSKIEVEYVPTLNETVIGLLSEDNSCVTKYEGDVTDEVGKIVPATKVYFDKCSDKRNVIFGNYCWQVIRTTETGGTKLLYNGEPVDGKCESTRENHKGIIENYNTSQSGPVTIGEEFLYGASFDYDLLNNTFTLINTSLEPADSKNIVGKYTCKSTSNTCSTIYYISGKNNNNNKYFISGYIVDLTNYSVIGRSSFNTNPRSLSSVGYMNNISYENQLNYPERGSEFGSSFVFDSESNEYTLSGVKRTINRWEDDHSTLNDTHYHTNENGPSNYIAFTFFAGIDNNYIIIRNGKGINDALNEMLYNDEVNTYNSNIKGLVDSWYRNNLNEYTNKIEDTIYCNNRATSNIAGWKEDGNVTERLKFKAGNTNLDLSCQNLTDQFSLNNNKAKLIYPVALLQKAEINNINNLDLLDIDIDWWSMSPDRNSTSFVYNGTVDFNGRSDYGMVDEEDGVRPVISIKKFNIIESGSGSEIDPWIVK